MHDTTSGALWACTAANGATCSSYALNPADVVNGNLGTSAEFVIENDGDEVPGDTQGYWPDFAAPQTMAGSALVVAGATTQGQGSTVSTDPSVVLLEDFAPATNPDHLLLTLQSPETTVWTVTNDIFYPNPTQVSIAQGATGYIDLMMGGPWAEALGSSVYETFTVSTTMPGSAEVTTYAGMIAPGDPGEWTLQIMPSLAASGSYVITVTGQDSMSGKSHSLTASVNVTPCQYVECGANSCGQIASNNGCGGTSPVVCASCQSGYFCSANQCCPNGTAWNAAEGACETVCPSGESVCPATGTPACKVQTGGGCRKIGSIVECN